MKLIAERCFPTRQYGRNYVFIWRKPKPNSCDAKASVCCAQTPRRCFLVTSSVIGRGALPTFNIQPRLSVIVCVCRSLFPSMWRCWLGWRSTLDAIATANSQQLMVMSSGRFSCRWRTACTIWGVQWVQTSVRPRHIARPSIESWDRKA